ncbi:MAG: alpha/beta fold hydrolase [Aestuariivirga sp.]
MLEGMAPNGTSYRLSGDKGHCVALIHGLGNRKEAWRFQVEPLSRYFRVLTYDLYGHGASKDPPEKPNLSLFSRQLAELLDHLEIPTVAVAGFSLGGMIARRFAMDFPSRLWALAILHSAHARDKAAHDAIQQRVEQARKDGPQATAEAALVRWFTDQYRGSHPEIMDEVRGWILANRKDVYADIYQVLVDGVTELVAPKTPISAPCLVMTGDEDYGNSAAMSRAIASEIPRSQLVILPGLRHMAKIEAPELFNRHLLDFLLKEHPRG